MQAAIDKKPLNEALARAVAAKLCRAAGAWSKTFIAGLPPGNRHLRQALYAETLAYALRLLELKLADRPAAETGPFLEAVRRKCAAIRADHVRGFARSRRLKSPPPPAPGQSEFDRRCVRQAESGRAGHELLEETYRDFCRMTGLGTDVLVGNGSNLAGIVFYLVIFGLAASKQPLSQQQKLWLLRASRECRLFLDEAIGQWLAAPTEQKRRPGCPALPARKFTGLPPPSIDE